ncbi:MAG: WD40 repeat domain-containing protein, partial [Chloroflexota bacterium]|nr:WD40 repeat domain-containing protein [Chloroflexota bacterium]
SAQDSGDTDPQLSLLLAIEAEHRGDTSEARDALRRSLSHFPDSTVLRGHTSPVLGASFSRDGTRIVSVSKDSTARLWNTDAGKTLLVLRGVDPDLPPQFSPDGRRVLTGYGSGKASVWDASTGKLLFLLGSDRVTLNSTNFSPDGRLIATGDSKRVARIWDVGTGKLLRELAGHRGSIISVDFSPDSKLVVTASTDGTARVWDAGSGRLVSTLIGEGDLLSSAIFSPNGTEVLGLEGDAVDVWNAASGETALSLKPPDPSATFAKAAYSPDGQTIATTDVLGQVQLWSARGGKLLWSLGLRGSARALIPQGALSVTFSPDGRRLVTPRADGTVQLWDSGSGKLLFELPGHTDAVSSVKFGRDGTVVMTASWDGTVRLWRLAGPVMEFSGGTGPLTAAYISPDGQRIVTASQDDTTRVWDAGTHRLLYSLPGHSDGWLAPYSTVSRLIVTISGELVYVWDAGTGRRMATLKGHTAEITCAVVSPDGSLVVTGGRDHTARIWRSDGHLVRVLTYANTVWSLHFSPDGKWGSSAGYDGAWMWDAPMARMHVRLGPQRTVGSSPFSPDGTRVLVTPDHANAEFWNVRTHHLLHSLSAPNTEEMVNVGTFSPDGKLIVTSGSPDLGPARAGVWDAQTGKLLFGMDSADHILRPKFSPDSHFVVTLNQKTAKVWDVRTRQMIAEVNGATDKLNDAGFSPDGKHLITASSDGTVRIYPWKMFAPAKDLLALASTYVTRDLTPEERAQYLHE